MLFRDLSHRNAWLNHTIPFRNCFCFVGQYPAHYQWAQSLQIYPIVSSAAVLKQAGLYGIILISKWASIPSLFLRFVLILKVYILEKIIVLISKKYPYFWLAFLFCLIFNKAAILWKPFSSWPKFFPSQLCDIIKATQSYLEHKEARQRIDMKHC